MDGVGIVGAIAIGILAGWFAEQVMNRQDGLLTNLIVGLLGSIIGGFIAGVFNISFAGFWGSLIVSAVGATILLTLVNALRGRRTGRMA